jgi:hypothetical protein
MSNHKLGQSAALAAAAQAAAAANARHEAIRWAGLRGVDGNAAINPSELYGTRVVAAADQSDIERLDDLMGADVDLEDIDLHCLLELDDIVE